jgi:signal transduction histidine kinase
VQEALTNVRKHAPDASATIDFSSTVSTVTVVVANTRATRPALTLPGAGVGLIGLRERADLLGGTFTAEPTADGGFRVSMTLPVVPD